MLFSYNIGEKLKTAEKAQIEIPEYGKKCVL